MNSRWTNFPFAPNRAPFFYGWVVLAAGTLATMSSVPGQTAGVGVFNDYLMEAMALNSVQISLAYMFGTIVSSFVLPFAGVMFDRYGTRVMVVFSSIGLGLSLVLMSVVDRPIAWLNGLFGGDAAHATVSLLLMFICFFLLRFFGQGCMAMVGRVALGKWFNHKRGRATAIAGIFVAFAFNGGPYVLNYLTEGLGWRAAALLLAGATGILMGGIGWLLLRDTPEECGLVMDGITDEAHLEKLRERVPDTVKEFTRAEAIRTYSFWVFSLALGIQGMVMTGIFFYFPSIGAEHLFTREETYAPLLFMPFVSVTTNVIAGWLSDRTKLRYLLYAMMAAQCLGTIGLILYGTPLGQGLFVLGYGVAGGFFAVLVTVTWPRFYGREHLGAVSGVNMSVLVFSSALGPVLFSSVQTWTGSYLAALLICCAFPIMVMVLGLRAENPQELVASGQL